MFLLFVHIIWLPRLIWMGKKCRLYVACMCVCVCIYIFLYIVVSNQHSGMPSIFAYLIDFTRVRSFPTRARRKKMESREIPQKNQYRNSNRHLSNHMEHTLLPILPF